MRVPTLIPALTFGAALLTGCGSAGHSAAAPPSVAAPSAVPSPSLASAPPTTAPNSQAPADTPVPAPSAVPASGSAAAANRPAMPTELLIPAIKVDAPVEHVGTTPDGAMEAPKEWNDVAWFDRGYRPGEPGSAVIAGHLDSTTDRAVFWDLHLLKPGDQVTVDEDDGSHMVFSVISSETYKFDQAPLQKIFGAASTPMLNLVTCNGTFDQGAKNYDKRLVVYSQLAS
jgi:sortase A